jgi:hypothetical protein
MEMGRYCKAYPIEAFTKYARWPADVAAPVPTEGEEEAADYYFLQENYTVTRGVFLDCDVIFAEDTPEWRQYCTDVLQFEIPSDIPDAVSADSPQDAPSAAVS